MIDFSMLIPQIAKTFGEKIAHLERETKGEIRLTLETLPVLQQDLTTTQEELFLRVWIQSPTQQGCIEETPFSLIVAHAVENDSTIQLLMKLLADDFDLNTFLITHFQDEAIQHNAQKYFFMMYTKNVDKKGFLNRKTTTKRISVLETLLLREGKAVVIDSKII